MLAFTFVSSSSGVDGRTDEGKAVEQVNERLSQIETQWTAVFQAHRRTTDSARDMRDRYGR